MANTCKNTVKPGADNPVNDAVQPANYSGGGGGGSGDNTIENIACDSSVSIGDVVRMNGSTVVRAVADSTTNSKAIGVCVAKSSSTVCNVQVCGYTDNVLSGLTANTNYFLSDVTPGALSTTPPTASGTIVIHIGRTYTTQSLVIQIGPQIRRS